MAGDKHVIQHRLIIGDADSRQVREIDINRWPDQYVDVVYCSNDGKRLYLQRYKRTWDEADTVSYTHLDVYKRQKLIFAW